MRIMLLSALALASCVFPSASQGAQYSISESGFKMIFDQGTANAGYAVADRPFEDLLSTLWSIETDSGAVSASDSANVTFQNTADNALIISGTAKGIVWSARCERIAPNTVTVTVLLTPDKQMTINRVFLFNAKSALKPVVAKTGLQDVAAFYRSGVRGIFASIDFPYSKVIERDGVASLTYPPLVKLEAGQEYVCHSYTVGETHLTGKQRYGYYEGEVDAMDSYVQNRFPSKFERPIFSTACIVNRYTQLEGNWIFYTMKDHPTLTRNRDILKRELELMGELGIEFYQVFPGVFDWGPNDPSDKQVREAMDWARSNGVRMGDYSGTGLVFCPHYAEHGNSVAGTDAEGQQCFGSRKFVDWYSDRVVSTARKYGFEMHVMDFLSIGICNDPNHGHPIGEDSVYDQIKGLVDVMDCISAVSPNMLIWPNSGCWSELLPKIAWHAPSQYLTDPAMYTSWQGLNMTRLLDDTRREQMVNIHYSHFMPYRYFTNCQYFFVQNSVVPDIRNFEYGALSTLAVTPNICPAEIRPWIESLNEADKKRVIAFYSKWTKFIKSNFELWKHTYHIGDEPSPGSLEVYSHAKGDKGFIFVVNPNYWSGTVEIPLGGSLGFSGQGECEIAEIYPRERLRLTAQGPYVKLGSKIGINVPAQTVLVLEVKPRPKSVTAPRLYGIPGEIEKTGDGYVLRTRGPQGTHERFAVVLPNGSEPILGMGVEKSVPQLDRRQWDWDPTDLKFLVGGKLGALADLTFRRKAASKDLRTWSVRAGDLDVGSLANWPAGIPDAEEVEFPLCGFDAPGPLANFRGAYLENGFSEDQETVIYLRSKADAKPAVHEAAGLESLCGVSPSSLPHKASHLASDKRGSWWLQTTFVTPLAQMGGCEAKFDEHTLIVFPFVDQNRVKRISAWISGQPVDVQTYRYPRNRGLMCRWTDIVGTAIRPGTNDLVVFLDMQ